jgi:hypothetical protein
MRQVIRGWGCVALASVVVAACGSSTTTTVTTGAGTTSTSTTTSTTSTTATQTVYFQGAAGAAAQKPGALELTADGTLAVEGVQWTSWGGAEATGTGNASYHGCNPNCAAAPVHTALVSIRLFGVRDCSGGRYYSGATLTLNSGQLLDKSFMERSWSPC